MKRLLIVTADDYGIGPATSRGILELAAQGLVTASVLLVTSPHAAAAVRAWRKAGEQPELGWHPCLTLDGPVAPPERVRSLLAADGRFHSLGGFVAALLCGRIRPVEVETELRAQYAHFQDLVGRPPSVVNTHHHVQVFPVIGRILRKILAGSRTRAYVRRVREPWLLLARVPGARVKRAFLTTLGRQDARGLRAAGFPGNDWLTGVTDPPCVADPNFLARWLSAVPGRVVELTCHPGYSDLTLLGRDCLPGDAQAQRREQELRLLRQASFQEACCRAGFHLVSPSEMRMLCDDATGRAA